jgi:putative ABC transport system permease protein
MLSKDVMLLVILASLLVIPVSWWIVDLRMENFAYRTQIDYSIYVIVAGAALGFVFMTVLFQSLRTARANPVDSLKYE